ALASAHLLGGAAQLAAGARDKARAHWRAAWLDHPLSPAADSARARERQLGPGEPIPPVKLVRRAEALLDAHRNREALDQLSRIKLPSLCHGGCPGDRTPAALLKEALSLLAPGGLPAEHQPTAEDISHAPRDPADPLALGTAAPERPGADALRRRGVRAGARPAPCRRLRRRARAAARSRRAPSRQRPQDRGGVPPVLVSLRRRTPAARRHLPRRAGGAPGRRRSGGGARPLLARPRAARAGQRGERGGARRRAGGCPRRSDLAGRAAAAHVPRVARAGSAGAAGPG